MFRVCWYCCSQRLPAAGAAWEPGAFHARAALGCSRCRGKSLSLCACESRVAVGKRLSLCVCYVVRRHLLMISLCYGCLFVHVVTWQRLRGL